jgi:hypothetical protein
MNLKVILKHLDQRNLQIYEAFRHNEADRKELDQLLAYVLPLWMSGTLNGQDQWFLTKEFNKYINRGWWELDRHPELRAKLLASIGPGHVLQHDYHARARRRTTALMILLERPYPDIRQDEVRLWCAVNSEATLLDMCSNYGIQEKDREPILNEYRNLVS